MLVQWKGYSIMLMGAYYREQLVVAAALIAAVGTYQTTGQQTVSL